MLKQQIRVYADDFANERSDRERIQADKETLKEKLNARESEIALLKEQVRFTRRLSFAWLKFRIQNRT